MFGEAYPYYIPTDTMKHTTTISMGSEYDPTETFAFNLSIKLNEVIQLIKKESIENIVAELNSIKEIVYNKESFEVNAKKIYEDLKALI